LRNELDGDDLYSLLLMMATTDHREMVVVEDDNDCLVLRHVVDTERATLVPGYGKATVEVAMHRVNEEAAPARVLAFLDRDFVGVGLPRHPSSDVIYTVLYDLDAELLAVSDLAERLAAAHSSGDSWRRVHEIDGVGLLDWLVSSCAPLGAARFVSVTQGYGLRLRSFPIEEFVSVPDGADTARLCELAVQRGGTSVPQQETLHAEIEAVLARTADPIRLCSGHDLFRTLGLVVRTAWGGSASGDTLERSARTAADANHVAATGLYEEVVRWQDVTERVVLS
jgi:hypothetical protein